MTTANDARRVYERYQEAQTKELLLAGEIVITPEELEVILAALEIAGEL